MNKLALAFSLIVVFSMFSGCIGGGDETPTPTTQASTNPPTTIPFNAQMATIKGTYYFDFESGESENDHEYDVWWEQETEIERLLAALGNAYLVMSNIDDYDAIGLAEALDMIENEPHLAYINGDDNETNAMPEGTIFLCMTNEENIYKVMIFEYGYSIKILYDELT